MSESTESPVNAGKIRLRYFVLLFAADLVFFGVTNPTHAHAWVLMVGGALMAATVWAVSVLSVRALVYITGMSRGAQRLLTGALTVVGLYVIFMQSIGQLNVRDALALVPLVAVFSFYVTHMRRTSRQG